MESPSLRIALQKSGRLTEKTTALLQSIGLKFDTYKDHLLIRCRNYPIELLFVRDDDIPEYVEDGVCDLGFVGANVVAERRADVDILKELDYGHCRLCIAAPKEHGIREASQLGGKRIATSYPNLTRDYFEGIGQTVDIVEISGSVEIAPKLDVADAICDLVSTGSTLRANGLSEVETIFRSQTQLVRTRKQLSAEKTELINKLLIRIHGQQKAQSSRYIMMNAPAASLDRIRGIIPALKSPTVLPLAEEGMIAVHSVIPIDRFWEVMEELREAGASGIVILPIESMID